MTKILIVIAFALGAAAILWMGAGFIGSHVLALTVTTVIGCVYVLGIVELTQFRRATATLTRALDRLGAPGDAELPSPELWLQDLDPSLRNAVKLRIEGERVGLPTPVFTPYIVGLLVMLGLLGTFVGMVDTLQGAVVALEGTTELEAIRNGLAAPIKGLGLAFGTSVAGVAASAMLGLISTLCRRERMLATRDLDTRIATVFREHSLSHNRQQTYQALQQQARALPDVAATLSGLAGKLEQLGDTLGDRLLANQEAFHSSVEHSYSELATSVEKSLRESLAESGRQAGESIRPIVVEAMAAVGTEAQQSHQRLSSAASEQLQDLSGSLTSQVREITSALQSGLASQEQTNSRLQDTMASSFERFSGKFDEVGSSLLDSFDGATASWMEQQQATDQQRLEQLGTALEDSQQRAGQQLVETAGTVSAQLGALADTQAQSLQHSAGEFQQVSERLSAQWQESGNQTLALQQDIGRSLEAATRELSESSRSSAEQMLVQIGSLLQSSEELVQARLSSEERWLDSHSQRMEQLTAATEAQLSALREEEAGRGQAATERLGALEATVTAHLATLGQELEGPMSRLIATASETPRAAAEVIGQLRQEIGNNIERDNQLLEERRQVMEQLHALSTSLEQSSGGQREAMEKLVAASADVLQEVGSSFQQRIGTELDHMSDVAANFAGSATELSALGEAFTVAVNLFNDSNAKLVENLARIEESLEQAHSRSDEQMGYYVAQAREVIDQSTLSQRELIEELRQLGRQEELMTAEAS